MHKKLASDLTSLAHSILQMKNKEDVLALKDKAYEVYEKLTILAYVEEYINTTPQAEETKEELLEKITSIESQRGNNLVSVAIEEKTDSKEETEVEQDQPTVAAEEIIQEKEELSQEEIQNIQEQNTVEESIEDIVETESQIAEEPIEEVEVTKVTEIDEQPFDELESLLFGEEDQSIKDEVSFIEEIKAPVEEEPKQHTLEDELKDTLPVDVMADLFQKVEPKKTVNDRLQTTIQIGLNDRIAFVKHLFDGNQADFNRVLSQLNTFKTEKEAKNFINKMVKPDYDWSTKEEYENRLLDIIERRFV
ncbi:hypothetical protein [Tenacibaculum agarivorans]|uniref:hypothetical protein n=1 Tax=Tenacibaculum agarivorans TaxID=1908389 RepID=UPI00094B7ED5|nr:hypothetical protein [Tenacibaculum agarivorans]